MRPMWAHAARLLTPEECNTIIQHEKDHMKMAEVEGTKWNLPRFFTRNSHVSWILPGSPLEPLAMKGMQIATNIALDFYNVQLSNFEPAQFTHYGPLCHYGKHHDSTMTGPNRLISAVILLNNPKEFVGGKFWIDVKKGNWPELQQGDMLVFPSYLKHQVKTVWKGHRYSLVMWGHYQPPPMEKKDETPAV